MMLLLCALVAGSGSVWAEDETAEFDFDTNAGTNFGITGTSSNSSTAGDITSNVSATINGVTITITSSDGSNNNRFWEKSPRLRLYGGTMSVSAGTNILKSIALTVGSGKWSATASTGGVSGSSTSYTWLPTQNTTPSSVDFTITGNTQIKKMIVTYEEVGDDPSIAANDVNIDCNATNGSIAYTINKTPTPAGTLTAAIKTGTSPTIENFAIGTVTGSAVPFTCDANSTTAARTATVTLTYTYGNSQTVTKDVTITQAAYVVTAPEFNLATGSYRQGTLFSLSSAGNTIYYSTDGNNPTTSSNVYTGPIAMTEGKVVYKAMAVDGNGNESSVSTRTYIGITPVTLPFSWANGTTRATINSTTGVSQTGLDSDYADNDYKLKFNGDNDNIIIFTDEKPVKVSIGVKMLGGGNTSKFSIQESENGAEFTEVEQLTISGSQDDVVNLETTQTFAATTRVIKLNFIKGSNVGVGPVSISAETATITLNAACTDGEKIYATYSSSDAFRVPANLTVSTVGVSAGKLVLTDYVTGDVVKANTGVLVSSTTPGDKTITLSAETGTEKDGNMLKASGDAGIEADDMAEADTKFYRLTMHDRTTIGFWWGAADGAAFNLGANKAYLAVPDAAAARIQSFWLDGETAGISSMHNSQCIMHNEVYDLQGRRVESSIFNSQSSILKKGLYIVNGKKIVIK